MAASTPPGHGRSDDDGADRTPSPLDRLSTDSRSASLQALAFWSAVVLPFLHVPLLTTGLTTPGERHAFLALLALNVVALYLGHPHGRE